MDFVFNNLFACLSCVNWAELFYYYLFFLLLFITHLNTFQLLNEALIKLKIQSMRIFETKQRLIFHFSLKILLDYVKFGLWAKDRKFNRLLFNMALEQSCSREFTRSVLVSWLKQMLHREIPQSSLDTPLERIIQKIAAKFFHPLLRIWMSYMFFEVLRWERMTEIEG